LSSETEEEREKGLEADLCDEDALEIEEKEKGFEVDRGVEVPESEPLPSGVRLRNLPKLKDGMMG
jgi:hypothetical protein